MPPPESPKDSPGPTSQTRRPSVAGFRKIGERERVAGSFIRMVTGTFVGPDGYTFERDMVRHPGAVAIVPLEADGDTVRCVRQYRAPLEVNVLELPAGKLDVPGEDKEAAARRELAEEVGALASEWTELGYFYNSPGFTDECTTCFLAEGLNEIGTSFQGIEEQHMTLERIRISDMFELMAGGELVDAKTIIGLMLTRDVLSRRAAKTTGER